MIGQAGVGKSRLLRELTLAVGDREPPPAVRLGSCPAYGAGLAYWALGEIVRGTFEIVDTDDADAAWRKLHGGIEELVADAETGGAGRAARRRARSPARDRAARRRSPDGGRRARTRSRCASACSPPSGP